MDKNARQSGHIARTVVFALAVALTMCFAGFAHAAYAADTAMVAGSADQEQATYKIVYKLKGGKQAAGQTTVVAAGKSLKVSKLKKPTRAYYKFMGWYTDSKLKKKAKKVKGVADASKRTLYAKWKRSSYKIVYKLNGGKNPGGYKKSVGVNKTVKVAKLRAPTRGGYTFAGWYKDSKLKKKATKVKGKSAASKRTLYAKWKTKSYVITYQANGGVMPAKYTTTYKTSKGMQDLPEPSRPGYAFVGWYVDSGLTKHVSQLKAGYYGNKTLYAKWRKRVLIAHRGYWADGAAQNSLAAVRAAAEKGFSEVEVDVQFTSDGVGVLSHNDDELKIRTFVDEERPVKELKMIEQPVQEVDEDGNPLTDEDGNPVYKPLLDEDGNPVVDEGGNPRYVTEFVEARDTDGNLIYEDKLDENGNPVTETVTVERYTNSLISTMKYADLQKADIPSRKKSGDDGDNYTCFEDFIRTCRELGLTPHIELKTGTSKQVKSLVKIVDSYGMKNNVIWSAMEGVRDRLGYVASSYPNARFELFDSGTLQSSRDISFMNDLLDKGARDVVISINRESSSRRAFINACKAVGMPLGIWTFANEAETKSYDAFYCSFTVNALTTSTVSAII